MKKVVLCPNPARDIGLEATMQTMRILDECGVPYSVCPLLDQGSAARLPGGVKFGSLQEELEGADMVVCFGGDGTILRVARIASRYRVPVLSINMGHLGFIAELESVDREMILRAVRGEYRKDTRIMLDIELIRAGEAIYKGFALNDAVISKGGTAKMIAISAYSDNAEMSKFSGDGIIIATPTGSTGYSMSAGGPLVEPEADSLIVTPICAHSLTAKAFVLSRDRAITVVIGSLADRTAYLSADGGDSIELQSGDMIRAVRSVRTATLVRVRGADFYKTINSKLKFDIKE